MKINMIAAAALAAIAGHSAFGAVGFRDVTVTGAPFSMPAADLSREGFPDYRFRGEERRRKVHRGFCAGDGGVFQGGRRTCGGAGRPLADGGRALQV